MNKPSESLIDWFSGRPHWLQIAVTMLNDTSTVDIERLLDLCISENRERIEEDSPEIVLTNLTVRPTGYLSLQSISDIQGINALAPRKPLTFTNDRITVVFGYNGSGKSGYVRILKHISGSRTVTVLHGNVYHPEQTKQKATIVIKKGDEDKSFCWDGSSTLEEVSAIDVFDTSFGSIYVADDNEVRYEPPLLALFSELISCCESLDTKIDEKIAAQPSRKPMMPKNITDTSVGKWYSDLTATIPRDEVLKVCTLTDTDVTEMEQLEKRLIEKAPAEKARLLRKQKRYLDSIAVDIRRHASQLSIENANNIFLLRAKINVQKNALDIAAQEFSNNVALNVGSDVWRELWDAAKKYSIDVAYPKQIFPHVAEGARCVLCQQPLADDAKKRMISFESFVKGELESSYNKCVEEYNNLLTALDEVPSAQSLNAKIDAAGEQCVALRDKIIMVFKNLSERRQTIQLLEKIADMPSDFVDMGLLGDIETLSESLELSALQFEGDAKSDNRDELSSKLNELNARKWVAENIDSVFAEIQRLGTVDILVKAKRSVNTKALSQKKGELAEELITDAFVQRFNTELHGLGASHIKVELVKNRVTKGRVLHRIRLKGAHTNCSLSEVLSEGESRIVSIAAFLADVTGYGVNTPLVFDDPISSLDQFFEEHVVFRLCTLALNRQVIIFTHRLSLLGLIQEFSTKRFSFEPDIICIRQEPWGTGEPGDLPLQIKKPDKTLNSMLNERLARAKKIFESEGTEAYYTAPTLNFGKGTAVPRKCISVDAFVIESKGCSKNKHPTT